jgi:hypothetical protein
MSRAINVNAPQADVSSLCQKKGVAISAIEALASGGTRVVLMNAADTETMKQAFGRKVMTGAVTRTPLRTQAR